MDKESVSILGGIGLLTLIIIFAGIIFLSGVNPLNWIFHPGEFLTTIIVFIFIVLAVLVLLGILAFMVYGSTYEWFDWGKFGAGLLVIACLVFITILSLVDIGLNVISVFIPSIGAILEGLGEVGLETIQLLSTVIMLIVGVYWGGELRK